MNRKRNTKARGKRTLRQKTFKNANQQPGQVEYGQRPISVNLSRFLVAPPSITVKLRYSVDTQITQAGFDFASKSWTINGLFDVDPAILSASIPGFNEWHRLYDVNQVSEVRVELDLVNETTEPTLLDITFVQANVPLNTWGPNRYGNAYSTTKTLSGKGGMDRTHISKTVDLAQLNGTLAYWGSVDNFQGTVSSNPATIMQLIVGAKSITGGVAANVYAMGFIEFTVHYADLVILTV